MSRQACYIVRGGALGIHQGRATHLAALWRCMWGRGQRGINTTCLTLPGFQSLPSLSTSKLGPSFADSQVGGFVYIPGPCGCLQELSCEAGSFSHCCNPHRFLQPKVLRLSFSTQEPWVAWSVSLPSCSSRFICLQMWGCLVHQLLPCQCYLCMGYHCQVFDFLFS